ncbi:Hypothetical predicted protein [Lynx pardinus]|uniref:Uncharacterized protein n=1 Tax=Lynx pardinus TaxID=191816 RepID=A0A485ML04_LYNPA|nr:Hypothetical predicted protein [Lynx pardinus]
MTETSAGILTPLQCSCLRVSSSPRLATETLQNCVVLHGTRYRYVSERYLSAVIICGSAHVLTDSAGRWIFFVFKEKKNVPVSVEMICSSARLKLTE